MDQHDQTAQAYHDDRGFLSALPWMLLPLIPTLLFIAWFFADGKIIT